jgi:hypothetical protein
MSTTRTHVKTILAGALLSGAVALGGLGLASATDHTDVIMAKGTHLPVMPHGRLALNPQPLPPIRR